MNVARTLHLAAIAFAFGIIASLLVRGFGTAYWAGWESTWLAESPDSVKTFLDYTYGLIPAVGPLPAMPDLAAVTEMRADRLPYLQTPISAAPWLIRMMILMAVAVIIPRLVFVLFDTWRMRRFKTQTSLSIDSPYYENILLQCAQDAVLGDLLVITSSTPRPSRETTVANLCRHWGSKEDSLVQTLDFDDEEGTPPALPSGSRTPIALIWFDAIETPEDEVHGAVIERVRATYEDNGHAVLALVVDMTEFSKRYASTPSRIEERQQSWESLVQQHNAKFFVLLDNAQSQLATVKSLKAWAAPRVANIQTSVTTNKEEINE